MPNVIVTPHIASASHATRLRMAQIAVQNIRDALAGRAEVPSRVEVLLSHQPVDDGRHHHLTVDHSLPLESPPGHQPGLDHPDRSVDRGGGDGHLLDGPPVPLATSPAGVGGPRPERPHGFSLDTPGRGP